MLTAMLAVENILGASHDLWGVNTDQEYQEGIAPARDGDPAGLLAQLAATQPRVPARVPGRTPAPTAAESEA